MTTKITEADLDDALKAKLDATGSDIVAPVMSPSSGTLLE